MTLVKICGITNLEDARAAVEAGADALGFNFYELSPRYISPETARQIADDIPREVLKVGVFVNVESPGSLSRIARRAGVELLQLHGDESPEYCRALDDWRVIKVLAVSADFELGELRRFPVDSIMLDSRDKKLRGGTGRVIDWSIAKKVNRLVPRLFLAGGLSPKNVADAITMVKPYAVDACSSLENSPGRKNHHRIREFVQAVRDVKP